MLSLKQFTDKYNGVSVGVPWGYKGECVSLIQRYINESYGVPIKARGNAIDLYRSFQNYGIGKPTKTPQYGDLIIWGKNIGLYGHVAIYIDKNTIFDQNNYSVKPTKNSLFRPMINLKPLGYIRMNGKLTPDPKPPKVGKEGFKVNDIVMFNQLANKSTATARIVKSSITSGKITKIYTGRTYPYLINTNAGFVNDNMIELKSKPFDAKAVAKDIWTNKNHKWGDGQVRKNKLGANYQAVQNELKKYL